MRWCQFDNESQEEYFDLATFWNRHDGADATAMAYEFDRAKELVRGGPWLITDRDIVSYRRPSIWHEKGVVAAGTLILPSDLMPAS